jgi:hypothetical protein
VGIGLARVDSATSIFAKACVTYIPVIVLATSVLTADVFGTGILHCTAIKQVPASHLTLPLCFSFPHFLTPKVSIYQDSIVLVVTFSQWYGEGSHSL